MEDDFVGAIKIKDGLFIGDEYAAQDFEFVVTNKVTHIINCAGKQIPNYWETVGVIYLTFDWLDSENQIVFDTKGEVVNEIFNFIEDAAKLGEGVLVHSIKGQSRSCCVLTAYFMKRYHWSLYKTLEFLTSRRSDLEIRTSFYHQLLNLESRLFQQADGNVTVNWFEMGPENDKEEILLRNTFLNARSAPFDEALVNPQAVGVDTRPRTINWGDERPSSKGGLSAFLTKESVAARLSKAPMVSCTSILKGSNKVFKLKVKEEVVASSSTKGNGSGLRANKSVRNFSEGRNSDAMVDDANTKAIVEKSGSAAEKNSDGKGGKGPNMMRSSSAIYLDKEDNNTRSASTGKGQSNDKSNNPKVSNVNGNIIHLTVNNYIAPVNNQSNTAQTNNFMADEPKTKSVAPKTPEPRPASQQKALEAKKEEETNKQAEPVIAATPSGNTSTKGSVSTNYLKSAIEKKLSKEYKSQLSSTAIKGDIQPVTVKTPSGTESKGAKPFKEYAKPSDLKVNYQVLLKNRETPPPRKREEAKRGLDSPNKKAVSKSSISTKGASDSSMPYSSYLNSMFSTSFSQLNTVTPSAYATTGEKKTPISAKAASKMSYNLTLSQKAQTLTRPQRSNAGQIGDKTYGSSVLGSTLSKSKLEPSSATLVGAKFNNYTSTAQTKGNPVRVTYEKIERPHSATPDRSATPQAGARRPGTSSGMGVSAKGDQRFSVPSKNTTKHGKKDSGTTQELLAKHRQRSSSPSPMSYNPALSNSSLSLKSKAKY